MVSLDSIAKGYSGRTLLDGASLQIGSRDRLGLVGPNGAGKSTLLAMLIGTETPDEGTISIPRDFRLGLLAQEIHIDGDPTALEMALRPSGEIAEVQSLIDTLPARIDAAADETTRHDLAERLARAHARFDELGGHDREPRARRVLAGLGFSSDDGHRPLSSFSGGWRIRAALARLLVERPDLLLLDEPTNHLDLESVLWLQDFLAGYPGALLIVSHDRAFLDATVNGIVELDARRLTRYLGTYQDYLRERALRREQLEAAARNQQRRIQEAERFIERFRAKNTKATQVQSRIKALAKEERIEIERDGPIVKFKFPQPERTGETPIELRGVAKSYGEHRVYSGLDFALRRGEKVVLVGPNGAGKSTLLKLLAGAFPPDEGERVLGLRARTGYYTQHRADMLDLRRTVLENARSVSGMQTETFVRTMLGAFLFRGDDVQKPASVLSGGEKSRLALAMMLLDPPTVLLMDEPTIHLDMASVDALVNALTEFDGALCFVSHDVHFIRTIARRVVRVEGVQVEDYPGDWEYYLWKRGQTAAAAPAAGSSASGAGAESSSGTSAERSARALREEKRRAAEARNELARRTRSLRAEIATVEGEIDETEREKAGLEHDLADPTTYATRAAEVPTLKRRLGELQRRLGELEERWLDAQAQLEAEISGDGDAPDEAPRSRG